MTTHKTAPQTNDLQQIKKYWQVALRIGKRFCQTWMAKLLIVWLVSFMTLMSSLLSQVVQNNNFVEIYPDELIAPTVMHTVTALIIALLLFRMWCLRTMAAKMFSATVLSLFMLGYDTKMMAMSSFVRAVAPWLTPKDSLAVLSLAYLILLIALSVCLGVVCDILIRKFKRVDGRDVALGVFVLVAYLFVVPAFSFVQILPTMIEQSNVQAAEFDSPSSEADASKPDIYYIVMDRYTSNSVLQEQFGFDNSDFTNYLRDNDFIVNDEAKSNYPYTSFSIASTMTADYTDKFVAPFKNGKVQSKALYHNLTQQSLVVKAIKKAGYKYYNIGSTYASTYRAPLADRDYLSLYTVNVFGIEKKLRGLAGAVFAESPYYRFAQLNAWPLTLVGYDPIGYISKQYSNLEYLASAEEPGGRFIFMHMLSPHDPYYFNADGSLSTRTGSDNIGKTIKDKYIGQLQYVNSQLRGIVDSIQERSAGQAVIIINSDEGPYPQEVNTTARKHALETLGVGGAPVKLDDMRDWPDDWLKMKFGILQAVHIPAATEEDLAQLSSVNVFRIVLNRYFGYQLDYLPSCNYGLVTGSKDEYNYADITERLQGSTSTYCQSGQSLRD